MNIFYAPDIAGDVYVLNDEESKHCTRVLRLVEDDKVQLIDGKGGLYVARIAATKPRCLLQVESKMEEYEKRPFHLHIAMSPLKNADRYEWFVEKAVEMGVDEITPIYCERTERRNINTERLERIVVSAMKQSIKAYKPLINEPITFSKFIQQSFAGAKYIAHCEESEKHELDKVYQPNNEAVILIGPEGDFSEKEIADALTVNYQPVTLGKSRLRTETAGMKACAIFNFINKC